MSCRSLAWIPAQHVLYQHDGIFTGIRDQRANWGRGKLRELEVHRTRKLMTFLPVSLKHRSHNLTTHFMETSLCV
jgi:hypothetical protein